jgi:hypothetical protein
MIMTPRLRKAALTAHVTVSVGWLGAVAAYLALAVAGLTTPDSEMAESAYRAMEVIGLGGRELSRGVRGQPGPGLRPPRRERCR